MMIYFIQFHYRVMEMEVTFITIMGYFCKIKQNNNGKKIIKSEKLISLRWVFICFTRSATSKYLYANDNRV